MPPKKATGAAAATKKASASPAHASYKDMIKDAIINLKERNGSSRQAIKKYVRSNNNVVTTSEAQFDSLFNKALRSGVEKGDFTQPKGPSGPVKLAKKESKPAEKKAAPKKEAKAKAPKTEKKESKPKAATKKAPTKKTAVKKAPAKKTETKAKANTAKPRAKKTATKTEATAPAVQDVPTVLKKTKSGRVSKQKAPEKKKAPAKKAATKKATPKKAAS